jgi:glucose-6-phosphate dehydrogenase assembly protein OpcA
MTAAGAPQAERLHWRGTDVHVARVASELARLHREHAHQTHRHAAGRTLNLLVARAAADEPEVEERLATLGAHSPSRMVILQPHDADRLDAELSIDCDVAAGGTGICHDRVVLRADPARLAHADALVAPLLPEEVNTVVWLSGGQTSTAESALVQLAHHVVLDSTEAPEPVAALARAARTATVVAVHDLAWLRLGWWRARIAAAFQAPERRRALGDVQRLFVHHHPAATAGALLLAGWVIARLGWEINAARHGSGRVHATGGDAEIELVGDADVAGWGGVEAVELGPVALHRGGASEHTRDAFAEALAPLQAAATGYQDALAAAVGRLAPA